MYIAGKQERVGKNERKKNKLKKMEDIYYNYYWLQLKFILIWYKIKG